jgi:hypothetical protein
MDTRRSYYLHSKQDDFAEQLRRSQLMVATEICLNRQMFEIGYMTAPNPFSLPN